MIYKTKERGAKLNKNKTEKNKHRKLKKPSKKHLPRRRGLHSRTGQLPQHSRGTYRCTAPAVLHSGRTMCRPALKMWK
jgi:hypothetical protein